MSKAIDTLPDFSIIVAVDFPNNFRYRPRNLTGGLPDEEADFSISRTMVALLHESYKIISAIGDIVIIATPGVSFAICISEKKIIPPLIESCNIATDDSALKCYVEFTHSLVEVLALRVKVDNK
jgi:hypothetical protein